MQMGRSGRSASEDSTLVAPAPPTESVSHDATLALSGRDISALGDDRTLAAQGMGALHGSAAPGGPQSADGGAPLARGATIGRYIVLSTLGAGGMGVVYAAYDPELDRRVALKLLRSDRHGPVASEGRTRLLREAQALAKLSHPNVVAIHDVGTHGDEVFLAMEFVEGETLGHWAKVTARSWRDMLRALVDAGRGVAAAHAAGLLHRDLKPDNIMVSGDGRVRVMDLGLARTQRDVPRDAGLAETEDTQATPELAALALRVTQAGSLMGTPAYMAPEQFRGSDVTTAADQYALCVTAWEILFGQRPFAGGSLVELAANVIAGKRAPPPRTTKVPAWVRQALERGLSTEPRSRWPSVEALLTELERGQARVRRRRLGAGLAIVGALAAGVVAARKLDEGNKIAHCEAEGASISIDWDAAARVKLRDALLATGVSYASTTADKVLPWLDAQAAAWTSARTESCLNATVRGTWDAQTLDRAQWCLDDRRMEFDALVRELSHADPETVRKATTAAMGLVAIAPCLDTVALSRVPMPTSDRATIRDIRAVLSRVGALESAGHYQTGLEAAAAALARAEEAGWPPLVASARLKVGSMLDRLGRYEEAELALREAYFTAGSSGATDVAAGAAILLVSVVGEMQARHDDGRTWAQHAEMMLDVLGDGPDGARRADALHALGNVSQAAGDYEKARSLHERAGAMRERTLGREHPYLAASYNNLANVHEAMGAYAEARALYERALALWERALGPEHPTIAGALNNLAVVHQSIGNYAEARALHERALAIRERALGREHPHVAGSLANLALVHSLTGDHAQAKALHQRALLLFEKAHGPDHPSVAASLSNLAHVHNLLGEYADAASAYERALALKEAALGPAHPDLAHPLVGLAEIALSQGRAAHAVPLAARAVELRATGRAPAEKLAAARFVLARALWEAPATNGRDRARAIALATQVRASWLQASGYEDDLAAVTAWLAERHTTP